LEDFRVNGKNMPENPSELPGAAPQKQTVKKESKNVATKKTLNK